MLVFCFIMLLFLIFQNIRNFILLYVMAENTSFLEVLEFLSRNECGLKLVSSHFSPGLTHLWVGEAH